MASTGKDGSDKNNKYDRQLRLWGDHGQAALESARVCLVNATATGTEILKNLILPGIGSFTIVDGHKVQGEDVGNNFFLTKDSLGESRAKVATELLGELNPDATGDFVEDHPEKLLQSNPSFFNTFTLVIATNLCERTLLQLSKQLWTNNVPLLVCRCYGFIGYMRLAVREHTVIESHPDNTHEDLRLDRQFDGLVSYCDSLDLDSMNKKDHSHTPWLVILYKYLQVWKQQHNGEAPKNYKEKTQFKELIKQGIRKNEEGVPEVEENFDEAVKSVNTSLVATNIPSNVKSLFEDPCCKQLNSDSKPFWILVRAIQQFVEGEGKGALPVRGTIPDMTADSERYIQLQQVYRNQAAEDVAIVTNKVHDLVQSLGRGGPTNIAPPPESPTDPGISEQDIKLFCKNAAFLRVVRCRSLEEEYNSATAQSQEIESHIADEDSDDEVVFYVLLRAVDKFYEEFNRFPGWYNDQVEPDIPRLKVSLTKVLQEWGLSPTIKDDYIHEICRYGSAELHTVASFLGGAASQEVIKIITGQFVPINNTYIYNAMKQTSITVQL
ncbi:NEDD8-activating enzyme E1 regulatory subunit-like isoform X1 [Mizuhopecten yessoensis]|uniref:NEDD8-activating enzyme E1 regulatory subunit-like isoform X1 n=1 Tax=Mizuhopecten yessoensis TaxID=6573 RepID=UPI000B4597B3|nr:NEDD8-activating enzyme E1 regulatory subunit-like isoform X1 [Mizuhopecten yessoensis]